jgi:hypothetical protein
VGTEKGAQKFGGIDINLRLLQRADIKCRSGTER